MPRSSSEDRFSISRMSVTAVLPGKTAREAAGEAGRESVAVLVEELVAPLLAHALDEGVVEVVGPRAGRLGEPLLDVVYVVLGDGARVHIDYEVEAGGHGFGNTHREGGTHAAKEVLQDLLHPAPYFRVVAVTGDVDEAGEEAAVRVGADKKGQPPAPLE